MKTSAKEIKEMLDSISYWFNTKKKFNEFCKAVAVFKNSSNDASAEFDLSVDKLKVHQDEASMILWQTLVNADTYLDLEFAAKDLADWASEWETTLWIEANGQSWKF